MTLLHANSSHILKRCENKSRNLSNVICIVAFGYAYHPYFVTWKCFLHCWDLFRGSTDQQWFPPTKGCHFPDDIFKCIFLNENVWISIKFALNFVPNGPINNISVLVQIMAWRRPGDKPLSEPMMVSLLTHICISRPQWVKFQVIHDTMKFM